MTKLDMKQNKMLTNSLDFVLSDKRSEFIKPCRELKLLDEKVEAL